MNRARHAFSIVIVTLAAAILSVPAIAETINVEVQSSSVERDKLTNDVVVTIELTPDGKIAFEAFTQRNVGRNIEVRVGSTVLLKARLVEKISGEPLDVYVQDHIFAPLGLTDTRYLPAVKSCGPRRIVGNAVVYDRSGSPTDCADGWWDSDLIPRIAPTSHDDDSPGVNPDFGRLIRGTVHDPTARRMGGVAGSAGVFSTAPDLGTYAQALLDRRAGRPSSFPLKQSTVEMMTTPQQPDSVTSESRGFGWDIDTAYSRPRGTVFPVGSFGHVGFTGVSMWLDPGSNSYVIILANVIHQPGGPPIVTLSGNVATAAARALHLYGS